MKKKLISIFLCAAICLSLMPTVAFAADETPITEVAVTAPTPVLGGSCAINADDVTITTTPANAYTVDEIYWFDYSALKTCKSTDTFQLYHRYKLYIVLTPKEGYVFEYDSNHKYAGRATINGKVEFDNTFTLSDELELECKKIFVYDPDFEPITRVEVTKPMPIAGESCAISADDVTVITTPANACTVDRIVWSDSTIHKDCTSTDTFILLHEYTFRIYLKPKDGYRFEYDDSDYTGEVILDGSEDRGSLYGVNLEIMSFPITSLEAGMQSVSAIEVTAPTPVLGGSCAISADDVTITTVPANACMVEEIYWYDFSAGKKCDPTDTFQLNHVYDLNLALMPKEGYIFKFGNNNMFTGWATVNGAGASAYNFSSPGRMDLDSKQITVIAPGSEPITRVEITGPIPKAGASCELSTDNVTITTTPANAYTVEKIEWYDYTDQKYCDPTDFLQPGHNYDIIVWLLPKNGYYFDRTGYSINYTGDAIFNGKKARMARLEGDIPGEIAIHSELLPAYEESITKIAVNSPVPLAGESCAAAAENVIITSTPANAFTVEGIEWFDVTDFRYCDSTDIFQPGHEYSLEVYVLPKMGYCFDYKSGYYTGEVTFNGEAPIEAASKSTNSKYPNTFFAHSVLQASCYDIWVNGVQFTSGDTGSVIQCGGGTATLDVTTTPYTLTLDNASVEAVLLPTAATGLAREAYFGIWSGQDLKLVINNSTVSASAVTGYDNLAAGVYVNGDLYISGTGGRIQPATGSGDIGWAMTLITRSSYGIKAEGLITVDVSDELYVSGEDFAVSGFYDDGDTIRLLNGTLIMMATDTDMRATDRELDMSEYGDLFDITVCEAWDTVTAIDHVPYNNDLWKYIYIRIAPIYYDLWVNGLHVSSQNCDDITGSGTAYYDADTDVLTLDNFTSSSSKFFTENGLYSAGGSSGRAAVINSPNSNLIINLIGDNSISVSDSEWSDVCGINCYSNLTINGSGSLDIEINSFRKNGYGVCCRNNLYVNDAKLNISVADSASGDNSTAIQQESWPSGLITDNAVITAQAGKYGLYCFGRSTNISNSQCKFIGGTTGIYIDRDSLTICDYSNVISEGKNGVGMNCQNCYMKNCSALTAFSDGSSYSGFAGILNFANYGGNYRVLVGANADNLDDWDEVSEITDYQYLCVCRGLINTVEISGIDKPVNGQMPLVSELAIPEGCDYRIVNFKWNTDSEFECRNEYIATVTLEALNGMAFDFDGITAYSDGETVETESSGTMLNVIVRAVAPHTDHDRIGICDICGAGMCTLTYEDSSLTIAKTAKAIAEVTGLTLSQASAIRNTHGVIYSDISLSDAMMNAYFLKKAGITARIDGVDYECEDPNIRPAPNQIDEENGFIYGLTPNMINAYDLIDCGDLACGVLFNSNYEFSTDAVFYFCDYHYITAYYTGVLFGDVNGDGWYDGMDAVLTSCIASGKLTQNDLTPAQWKAADCNHDGVIDSSDVLLLEDAGVLISSVGQLDEPELLQTNSAYVEYLNFIDQTVETETSEVVEEEPTVPEIEPARPEPLVFRIVNAIALAIWSVVNFFTNLFD